MKTIIICRKQAKLTDALTAVIEKKVSKLDKFFRDEAEAHIALTKHKTSAVLELTISMDGTLFRSEVEDETFYHAIDSAVDIIERQIRKNKTRLEKRLRSGAFVETEPAALEEEIEEAPQNIIKKKSFTLTPMKVEEAILQMNLLEHNFFVFENQDTDAVCVVYKRKDGSYGLIETDR